MKLTQCQGPGCTATMRVIKNPPKYCPEHHTIELVCGKCHMSFLRKRVVHDAILSSMAQRKKEMVAPCCSKSCASQRARIRGGQGAYQHKEPTPSTGSGQALEPESQESLMCVFDHDDDCQRTTGQKRRHIPIPLEAFYDLANETLYSCVSVPITDALVAWVNDSATREKARWEPPLEGDFRY